MGGGMQLSVAAVKNPNKQTYTLVAEAVDEHDRVLRSVTCLLSSAPIYELAHEPGCDHVRLRPA